MAISDREARVELITGMLQSYWPNECNDLSVAAFVRDTSTLSVEDLGEAVRVVVRTYRASKPPKPSHLLDAARARQGTRASPWDSGEMRWTEAQQLDLVRQRLRAQGRGETPERLEGERTRLPGVFPEVWFQHADGHYAQGKEISDGKPFGRAWWRESARWGQK